MTTRTRILAAGLVLTFLATLAAGAESTEVANKANPTSQSDLAEPATIEFWNRPIAVLRARIAGADPQQRAQHAVERLQNLPLYVRSKDIEVHAIEVEDQKGYAFTYQGRVLLFLSENDLDKESKETLPAAAQKFEQALDGALQARADERNWPKIRSGLIYTSFSLAIVAGFIWLVLKLYGAAASYVRSNHQRFPVRPRLFDIDLLPHIAALLIAVLRAAAWFFAIGAVYVWLTFALGQFPYTEPWGEQLGGYVVHFFQDLGISALHSLPGIFSCIVIFLLTRWVVRLGRAFFLQIARGSLRLSWMDADVARATERIFFFVAWVFAVVVAYPYIPGSSTEAFKGISVFFGLVISLGSTGIINQVMSGLFVVYSKALKTGEWVLVNETEGEVEEVGLLSVKVRTIEQQEVTIPHSVLVSTTTKNFSRLGQWESMAANVTVTIGYDAPWRQVHALLLMAAERTGNILQSPQPYVLQRALSDFYVEYTLIVRLADMHLRPETLSQLHGNVQDAFNEYGVQIMSPHFMMQPEGNIVVPRSKWHAAPAAPDNGSGTVAQDKHVEAGR